VIVGGLVLELKVVVCLSMGSACCVAARDKTIPNGSSGEILHRNIRYSPTWSFRWDNRGRVAGEETSIGWLSDGVSRNDRSEIKYEPSSAEEGSPLENSRRCTWQKSLISEGTAGHVRTPASGTFQNCKLFNCGGVNFLDMCGFIKYFFLLHCRCEINMPIPPPPLSLSLSPHGAMVE
jgi:hypothetical protein